MILIVGVTHYVQNKSYPGRPAVVQERVDRFRQYLMDLSIKVAARAIAEENNQEFLTSLNTTSVPQEVADSLGFLHLFCEPDSESRSAMGAPTRAQLIAQAWQNQDETGEPLNDYCERMERSFFPIREHAWIDRLQMLQVSPVIFICGSGHMATLPVELAERGIAYEIICPDWQAMDDAAHGLVPEGVRLL